MLIIDPKNVLWYSLQCFHKTRIPKKRMLRLRRWNVQLIIPVSFHLGDQHQAKAKITTDYILKLIID